MDPPASASEVDMARLERAAAAALAEALDQTQRLHQPGERDRHRQRLARAIDLSSRVVAAAAHERVEPTWLDPARTTLLLAHAARAEDARHGAGQLSQSAQRAPTEEDCDEGWQRVAGIVQVCEASAREATALAAELDGGAARDAAERARAAATDARRIVEQRNRAYTFHADPSFSFGEGWYLAAAGILAGVRIQIEPDEPQTAQAERFLRDAGLGSQLVPYRARPRANKALPDLVARAFRADPQGAQARLRAGFLGEEPIPSAIEAWAEDRLGDATGGRKLLVWLRYGRYQPSRNTTHPEVLEICRRARRLGITPVLIGDAPREGERPAGALDLTLFWKLPLFQGLDMRRAQLQLFEAMRREHGLCGQIGVTTAGMDGPALLGLPTMYLTDQPNVHLGKWVGAVPGYEEVLRVDGYLDRVSERLTRWA